MATYASLSQAEKDILTELGRLRRPVMGEIARLMNHLVALWDYYNTHASAVLTTVDNTEVVPDNSGLQNGNPITKAEIVTNMSYADHLTNTAAPTTGSGFNTATHRLNYQRDAGADSIVG